MRLRLVPQETNIDFFKHARLTLGASVVAMILSVAVWINSPDTLGPTDSTLGKLIAR